jgi:ABC-2 type transport system ATP-binding protein
MVVVEVENLTKIYGYPPMLWAKLFGYTLDMPMKGHKMVRAIDNLTLSVQEGEVFGLLGPNGSGKTTLVKLILDINRPTSGRISVFGRRPGNKRVHREVGYLPEQPYFYDNMNAVELLQFYGGLYRMDGDGLRSRIREALGLVGLIGSEHRRLRSYSKGMLQRIGLAQALLSHPKLVLLDEPSTGLDPVGRKQVKDIIARLRVEGSTVFFNTHILSDVEDVADRVAIIHRGKLLKIGKVSEMTISTNRIIVQLRKVEEKYITALADLASKCEVDGDSLVVHLTKADDVPEAIRQLVYAGADIFDVRYYRETLEDVFVREVMGEDGQGGVNK